MQQSEQQAVLVRCTPVHIQHPQYLLSTSLFLFLLLLCAVMAALLCRHVGRWGGELGIQQYLQQQQQQQQQQCRQRQQQQL
jgi:hypothetical protein